MSPVRGHLFLLGTTALFSAGAFALNFLYVQNDDKGRWVAEQLNNGSWWKDGRASFGAKALCFWSAAAMGYCVLLIAFDLFFPTTPVLHVWFELLVLLLLFGTGATFGVMVGVSDLPNFFPGMKHAQTFCLLGLIGVILSYVAIIMALITALYVWRVPKKIVQSADGKRHWSRSIRQIYHRRYTGLPGEGSVVFADLDSGVPLPKREESSQSWYQESAYELHTQQRREWVPPVQQAQQTTTPPSPYGNPPPYGQYGQ